MEGARRAIKPAVATGRYLAANGADQALLVNAPTSAQAGQFYIGDGDWGMSEFHTALTAPGPGPLEEYCACANTVPESALGLISNPSSDDAIYINMLCVKPPAANVASTARPPSVAAKIESDALKNLSTAYRTVLDRAAGELAGMRSADSASPPFPYFAGKYAISFKEGWLVSSGGNLAMWLIVPSDGTGLFNVYRQPQKQDPLFGAMDGVVVQTMTGEFLQMPSGGAPGPIGLDGAVASVASASAFAVLPALGSFTNLVVWPVAWQHVTQFVSLGGGANNTLSAITGMPNDAAVLTRLVHGLQDIMAPNAPNLWDGADLRGVDMRLCVGFLTGAAAQWGNANLAYAILEGMDLTAISIGNAVTLSNARLAGVKWKAGQDLSHASLAGADLSGGVDLTAVRFGSADLSGANLTKAKLAGIDLSQTRCAGTIFNCTDLSSTKLPTAPGALGQGSNGAAFEKATVPLAALGSDWRNLDLSCTKLTPLRTTIGAITADYAQFQETILDNLTITPDANNKGASFQFADLTNTSLSGASVRMASFSSALLYGANLAYADLTGSTWSNAFAGAKQYLFTLSPFGQNDLETLNSGGVPTDLNAAFAANGHALQNPNVTVRSHSSAWNIKDDTSTYTVNMTANALNVLKAGPRSNSAHFYGACLADADLSGGSFAGVYFSEVIDNIRYGVQLTGNAQASGVDFQDADFTAANISSATPNQPNLQGAYLYNAKLDEAFMFNANLQGAFLCSSIDSPPATLTGAMLAGATLTGAQLDGAVMTGALVGLTPQGAPPNFAGGGANGGPGAGVPLFTLDAGIFTPILDNGANWGTNAPEQLQNAFSSNHIALSGPAFFTAYPGQPLWDISLTNANLDPPPTPSASGWVWTGFTIMRGQPQHQGTSDLVVYGTMLWMFAPDLKGALQPLPYAVVATALGATDMAATTVCPNSRPWSMNQENGVTWEAAMMPPAVTAPHS